MKKWIIASVALLSAVFASAETVQNESVQKKYEPTWESVDKRPVPAWWSEAKFGIFIHWGPYAVPAYAPVLPNGKFSWDCYAEWYQGKMIAGKETYLSHHKKFYGNAPYANFAANFKARFYNPAEWASLFKRAGAKYVVLTSKHHDGYALWPSAQSPYFNSVVLGSGRDLAGEFCKAMREAGLKRGFYFSMLEYANPQYPGGRDSKRTEASLSIADWNRFVNFPQLKDLADRYEADIIWPDGEWDYTGDEHGSAGFLAWLYNDSKVKDTVVVNDRWGKDTRGRHGGHYTTEYGHGASAIKDTGVMHPWEECRGIGGSFGYNQFETTEHYMSRTKCIRTLVSTVSRGGNLLLNVGPDADGRIPAIMEDRLLAIGEWLKVNGDAIYATTRANIKSNDKDVYLTAKGDKLYVIDFKRNASVIKLEGLDDVLSVELLGSKNTVVKYSTKGGNLAITRAVLSSAEAPCDHAWVYAVTRGKKNPERYPANATLKSGDGPLVQAHRGGKNEFDDNAVGAFRNSLNKGVRGFEIDIRFSKDRKLVVMHDGTVDRTTDGTGAVESLTLEELKKFRLQACSEPIPTAEEAFEVFRGRKDVFIEIEMKAYPSKFYDRYVLEEYCRKLNVAARKILAPGTYAFTCFNRGTLEMMRRVDPSAPLGLITHEALNEDHIALALKLGCCSVAPSGRTTKRMVDRAHEEGLTVCLWPAPCKADWDQLKEKGADRVTSDYPVLLTKKITGKPIKLVALDLDATLCQHRSTPPAENLAALKNLEKQYKCIMVGAGTAPRIYKQMGNYPIDIVGNYGMQIAEAADGNFRIVKQITNNVDKAFFLEKCDYLRKKYGYTEYSGKPIEFHASGMVTFGLLGTSAQAEQKVTFDPDRKKRRAMYPEVLEIFKDYSCYIGGSTSFDFAGKEYNKYDATVRWAAEHGIAPDEIVFIGDDFADGGGDSHIRIKGMDYILITDFNAFPWNVRVLAE